MIFLGFAIWADEGGQLCIFDGIEARVWMVYVSVVTDSQACNVGFDSSVVFLGTALGECNSNS